MVRRPESDRAKQSVAEGCLQTAEEICRKNPRLDLDIHFYNDDPLLRLLILRSKGQTLAIDGLYRYDASHPMRFIGAEENRLLTLSSGVPAEKQRVDAVESRFNLRWNNTSALRAVLVDSMEYHVRAWREAFESLGFLVDPERLRYEVYWNEGLRGRDLVKRLLAVSTGQPSTLPSAEVVAKRKEELYLKFVDEVRPNSGLSELLLELRSRGVPTGLVSGAGRSSVEALVTRLFPRAFDVIITGSDVHEGKPAPAPYHAALAALDLVDRGPCVAIENAPLGVQSASEAGLSVLGVLRNSPLDAGTLSDAGALEVCADVARLARILHSWTFFSMEVDSVAV